MLMVLFNCPGLLAEEPNNGACITCHEGIEKISNANEMADLSCVDCHQGNADATTDEAAHKGIWANPSDLRVIAETCGDCHSDLVNNALKSLHATSAGVISGTRYTWGAQKRKNSLYSNYAITDDDGNVPKKMGALKLLRQIPKYDPAKKMTDRNHPADDYLREQCLRCHIWSSGHERDGDYRASGCAACHVVYSDDGTYEGNDKAISKEQKDRPRLHRITNRIPSQQCIHCHNRGGRTGVSYIGTMESDAYGSPWGKEAGKKAGKKLHSKFYNHLTADIHYDRGMECIDCHTSLELHGDGNIYSKKEQAVEIECVDCHGTQTQTSNLRTSRGNALTNLRRENNQVILRTKVTNRDLVVKQTKAVAESGPENALTAMGLGPHMEKLECYACHAKWAPQCYGCHTQQDTGSPSNGWIDTKNSVDPSKAGLKANRGSSTFKWRETRSYLRWETPVLGINSENKVAPFIPGCQVIFTQIGKDGKAELHNKIFITKNLTYGIAHNPIQPHTISREPRSCEDCHSSRKALGLGTGIYNARKNGLDIDFELERIVDEEGKQIQATSHVGARPFNKEEQQRIQRVNVCTGCHSLTTDQKTWKKVVDIVGFVKSNKEHQRILNKIMRAGTNNP